MWNLHKESEDRKPSSWTQFLTLSTTCSRFTTFQVKLWKHLLYSTKKSPFRFLYQKMTKQWLSWPREFWVHFWYTQQGAESISVHSCWPLHREHQKERVAGRPCWLNISRFLPLHTPCSPSPPWSPLLSASPQVRVFPKFSLHPSTALDIFPRSIQMTLLAGNRAQLPLQSLYPNLPESLRSHRTR